MRQSLLVLFLLIATAVGIGRAPCARAADAAPDQSMRMYRDPETGRVGHPSAAALQAESAAAVPAPPAPAAEEPVQVPAGGVKVNLRGSHRPAVVRYADPAAPTLHECVEGRGAQ